MIASIVLIWIAYAKSLIQDAPAGKPKQAAGRPSSGHQAGGPDPAFKRAAANVYADDSDSSLDHPGMAAPRRQRAPGSRPASAADGQRCSEIHHDLLRMLASLL